MVPDTTEKLEFDLVRVVRADKNFLLDLNANHNYLIIPSYNRVIECQRTWVAESISFPSRSWPCRQVCVFREPRRAGRR